MKGEEVVFLKIYKANLCDIIIPQIYILQHSCFTLLLLCKWWL